MVGNLLKGFSQNRFLNLQTIVVIVATILLAIWLASAFALDRRGIFLPGQTTDGHVLVETACNSCHEGFKPVSNKACLRCHQAEMATDAHGQKKFRDPRWGELLTRIDVLTCTACHNEHVPTDGRSVHQQQDLCMNCHLGVINGDLASHTDFSPKGCWAAGCHNFHDHTSISTGFLRRNLDQPPLLTQPMMPTLAVGDLVQTIPEPDLGEEFLGRWP